MTIKRTINLYTYFAWVSLSVCVFVSKKHQNRQGLWILRITNICLSKNLIFINFINPRKKNESSTFVLIILYCMKWTCSQSHTYSTLLLLLPYNPAFDEMLCSWKLGWETLRTRIRITYEYLSLFSGSQSCSSRSGSTRSHSFSTPGDISSQEWKDDWQDTKRWLT